ncbi:hypothetical protein EIP86_002515 [Pleurotus ostreatoroseus]|nr:hypothetical protein EIP86_002515 [Pleurotus ostreatoroseus]
MDRFFTWDLAIKDDHKLITSGPYAIVRHPGYIAAAMIGVGTLMCHLGKGSWFFSYGGLETFLGKAFALAWSSLVIFTPAMLCSRVNVEDEVLHKQFGHRLKSDIITHLKLTIATFLLYIRYVLSQSFNHSSQNPSLTKVGSAGTLASFHTQTLLLDDAVR